MGETTNAYKFLVGNPKGRISLEISKRWQKKKKMKLYLGEMGCEGMKWIKLTQDMSKRQVL
jgi:hypothetical protein